MRDSLLMRSRGEVEVRVPLIAGIVGRGFVVVVSAQTSEALRQFVWSALLFGGGLFVISLLTRASHWGRERGACEPLPAEALIVGPRELLQSSWRSDGVVLAIIVIAYATGGWRPAAVLAGFGPGAAFASALTSAWWPRRSEQKHNDFFITVKRKRGRHGFYTRERQA